MAVLDKAIERGQNAQRDRLSGQKGLFAGTEPDSSSEFEDIPDVGEWGDREKWTYEKEALGYYVTGHPLQKYESELKRFAQVSATDIEEGMAGSELSLGGVVTGLKKIVTRKGDTMATFDLEDLTGTVEVVVWPKTYQQSASLLEDSEIPILVRGRCEVDGRGDARVLCSQILRFDTLWRQAVQKTCILIPVPTIEELKLSELKLLLNRYPGSCPLEFELLQTDEFRMRVIPREILEINPVPDFIREVENLFGENSVKLYT
jgi:DNA polymerase-3 subunit alpha